MIFFENVLGLKVLRHEEFDTGCEATCNGPYGGELKIIRKNREMDNMHGPQFHVWDTKAYSAGNISLVSFVVTLLMNV